MAPVAEACDDRGAHRPQRGHVHVVVVVVAHELRGDRRQRPPAASGALPLRAMTAEDPVAQHRIDEQRHAGDLHQPARVPEPDQPRRLSLRGRDAQRRAVRRHRRDRGARAGSCAGGRPACPPTAHFKTARSGCGPLPSRFTKRSSPSRRNRVESFGGERHREASTVGHVARTIARRSCWRRGGPPVQAQCRWSRGLGPRASRSITSSVVVLVLVPRRRPRAVLVSPVRRSLV